MYLVYVRDTGEIRCELSCPDFLLAANVPDGCSAIQGDSSDGFRVDVNSSPHRKVVKQLLPVSNRSAGVGVPISFGGLPIGTRVAVEGTMITVADGTLEFSIDFPGDYSLEFSHPLYLNTTIRVTVT